MYYSILAMLLIISCSSFDRTKKSKEETITSRKRSIQKKNYEYQDLSGTYRVSRELIQKGSNLYFESTLHDPSSVNDFLEKHYIILKKGRNESGEFLVPLVSQFTTWVNKKKFFTEIKVNSKKKNYEIYTKPSEKVAYESFVNGQWICPFSMLPECLEESQFISSAKKGEWIEKEIWVFWDLYPYQQKFFSDVQPSLFEKVKIIFEGKQENYLQFSAEVSNQSISILYTDGGNFEKMIWVAQGVSLILQ